MHASPRSSTRCRSTFGLSLIVQAQHPFTPLVYPKQTLILSYADGMQLLIDNGFDVDPMGDLSTPMEKQLGRLVKEKYNTDFYILDKFPLSIRPFYTMPNPQNPVAFSASLHR